MRKKIYNKWVETYGLISLFLSTLIFPLKKLVESLRM